MSPAEKTSKTEYSPADLSKAEDAILDTLANVLFEHWKKKKIAVSQNDNPHDQ
jgi:hypothetical protein